MPRLQSPAAVEYDDEGAGVPDTTTCTDDELADLLMRTEDVGAVLARVEADHRRRVSDAVSMRVSRSASAQSGTGRQPDRPFLLPPPPSPLTSNSKRFGGAVHLVSPSLMNVGDVPMAALEEADDEVAAPTMPAAPPADEVPSRRASVSPPLARKATMPSSTVNTSTVTTEKHSDQNEVQHNTPSPVRHNRNDLSVMSQRSVNRHYQLVRSYNALVEASSSFADGQSPHRGEDWSDFRHQDPAALHTPYKYTSAPHGGRAQPPQRGSSSNPRPHRQTSPVGHAGGYITNDGTSTVIADSGAEFMDTDDDDMLEVIPSGMFGAGTGGARPGSFPQSRRGSHSGVSGPQAHSTAAAPANPAAVVPPVLAASAVTNNTPQPPAANDSVNPQPTAQHQGAATGAASPAEKTTPKHRSPLQSLDGPVSPQGEGDYYEPSAVKEPKPTTQSSPQTDDRPAAPPPKVSPPKASASSAPSPKPATTSAQLKKPAPTATSVKPSPKRTKSPQKGAVPAEKKKPADKKPSAPSPTGSRRPRGKKSAGRGKSEDESDATLDRSELAGVTSPRDGNESDGSYYSYSYSYSYSDSDSGEEFEDGDGWDGASPGRVNTRGRGRGRGSMQAPPAQFQPRGRGSPQRVSFASRGGMGQPQRGRGGPMAGQRGARAGGPVRGGNSSVLVARGGFPPQSAPFNRSASLPLNQSAPAQLMHGRGGAQQRSLSMAGRGGYGAPVGHHHQHHHQHHYVPHHHHATHGRGQRPSGAAFTSMGSFTNNSMGDRPVHASFRQPGLPRGPSAAHLNGSGVIGHRGAPLVAPPKVPPRASSTPPPTGAPPAPAMHDTTVVRQVDPGLEPKLSWQSGSRGSVGDVSKLGISRGGLPQPQRSASSELQVASSSKPPSPTKALPAHEGEATGSPGIARSSLPKPQGGVAANPDGRPIVSQTEADRLIRRQYDPVPGGQVEPKRWIEHRY